MQAQCIASGAESLNVQASMEDTRGFGGSPLSSRAPTGGKAVAGAGAGLANDTGEYNCFLNAIIQV
jgi:hypothetical protein